MRALRTLLLIISILSSWATVAHAQDCQQVLNELLSSGPGALGPDQAGGLASWYNQNCHGGGQSEPQQPMCPAGTTYCSNANLCCGSDQYCSRYGCTPIGAIECGNYYCNPGQLCSRGGGCHPQGTIDCGNYYCQEDERCGSGFRGCLSPSDVDC